MRTRLGWLELGGVLGCGLLAAGSSGLAQEPLHQRIDQLVEANQIGPMAAIANDSEFLRRAYLDLTGWLRQCRDSGTDHHRSRHNATGLNPPAESHPGMPCQYQH